MVIAHLKTRSRAGGGGRTWRPFDREVDRQLSNCRAGFAGPGN
jgi:hypothetical protein